MRQVRNVLLIFFVVFCFSSCGKETSVDADSFSTCDADGIIENPEVIGKLLVGSWRWTKSQCGFCQSGTPEIIIADREVVANFKADNTFSIIEDSEPIGEGIWLIEQGDSNTFFISINPREFSFLDGSIRVCATELISDARPWDGSANLFERIE